METPTYGPVELLVIGFDADEPPEGVVAAVAELALEQTVMILDLVLVRRTEDGYTIVEIHEFADQYGFPELELQATGGDDDDDAGLGPRGRQRRKLGCGNRRSGLQRRPFAAAPSKRRSSAERHRKRGAR